MASITQAQLLNSVLDTMEEEYRIPKANAKDFIASLTAVVKDELAEGNAVPLFGIVRITPSGVPAKPKRKGTDRLTGEDKTFDPVPAKIRVKASVAKAIKDELPDPTDKVGKRLIAEAKDRQRKAAERAAAREAEAEKAERKTAKSSTRKSAGKRK